MKQILVLCHGNINRSAAAEAFLKKCLVGWSVTSAGFVNPGRRASAKMREAVRKVSNGKTHLDAHRSQLVTPQMCREADVILFMDGGNLRRLRGLVDGEEFAVQKAVPLGKWASPPVERIADPAFMAKASPEFKATVEQIYDACKRFAYYVRSTRP